MNPNFFPLGAYSKPLASKIGLEASVVLFELAREFKQKSFTLTDFKEYSITSSTWVKEALIDKYKILVKNEDELYNIDYEVLINLLDDSEPVKTKAFSKECIKYIQEWIAHLKKKRGTIKSLGDVLLNLESKDELSIIKSINYSISNGFTTLYFKDIQATGSGGRFNKPGDKTDSDRNRDYSNLIKKAGE